MSAENSRRDFLKLAGLATASVGMLSIPSKLLGQSEKPVSASIREVKAYAFLCGILKTQTQ